jgi:hypothetical protein
VLLIKNVEHNFYCSGIATSLTSTALLPLTIFTALYLYCTWSPFRLSLSASYRIAHVAQATVGILKFEYDALVVKTSPFGLLQVLLFPAPAKSTFSNPAFLQLVLFTTFSR